MTVRKPLARAVNSLYLDSEASLAIEILTLNRTEGARRIPRRLLWKRCLSKMHE